MSAMSHARPLTRRVLRSVFAGVFIVGRLVAVAAGENVQELRTAEEVRRLTPKEAEQHLPVRIKGVVTFFDSGLYSRFVQDDTAGIYLQDIPGGLPMRTG
jgi:hypothetical protein